MLSQAQRATILELNTQGVTKREIARILGISRLTVRKVLRANSSDVPECHRAEKAEPYRQQIVELLSACKGNLVRVHEELTGSGAALSYPALTAFCRRRGIGQAPLVVAGRYHFEPGEEMQHDTSPHVVELGGKKHKVQTASAVLCYSRMLYFQCSPMFQRFDCKVFSDRRGALLRRRDRTRDDRQHTRSGVARDGARDGSRARDGGVRRTLQLPFRGPDGHQRFEMPL